MADLVPFPRTGVVRDVRGDGRALRATWHHEEGLVVISVWRGALCVATTRVRAEDVPLLVDVLVGGLGAGYGASTGTVPTGTPPDVAADAG